MLGFSYRKSGNLDEAAKHYDKALGLDPKHKGALEYQGELFLMLGDKGAAEENLEKLDKICWLGCEELDELRTAIRKFSPWLNETGATAMPRRAALSAIIFNHKFHDLWLFCGFLRMVEFLYFCNKSVKIQN